MNTTRWVMRGGNDKVHAYVDHDCLKPGESTPIRISSETKTTATVTVYRLGHYAGMGGFFVAEYQNVDIYPQGEAKKVDDAFGILDWQPALNIETGTDWLPGVYEIKVTSVFNDYECAAILIITDPNPAGKALVHIPTFTYQAYNRFGGASLYAAGSTYYGSEYQDHSVSLARPYAVYDNFGTSLAKDSAGMGTYPLVDQHSVFWLESTGAKLNYVSGSYLNDNPHLIKQSNGAILLGHDEYWTEAMMLGLEAAIDTTFLFLGGNDLDGRLEINTVRGHQCIKRAAHFEDECSGRATRLHGLEVQDCFVIPAVDMVIKDSDSWVFAGTGLKPGDTIKDIVGFEYQSLAANKSGTPDPMEILAESYVPYGGLGPGTHHAVAFENENSAARVHWGSIFAGWALGRRGWIDSRFQRANLNVLERMAVL